MQIPKISKKGFLLLNFISSASISASVISPAFPKIKSFYSLEHRQLEWVMSLFLAGYMIGQLIYGPLSNRIGRVFSLRIGMVLHLLGIVICYLGYSLHLFSILVIGRFIASLGAASGLVCAYVLMNESLNVHEAKATFAYTSISFGFATTLAVIIGGFITEWLGWQYCFVFLFLHTMTLLSLTLKISEPHSKQNEKMKKDIQISTRNLIKLICFSALMGLNTCVIYCYTTAAPLISKYNYELSPSAFGLWNAVNLVGMVLGSLTVAMIVNVMEGMHIIWKSLGMFLIVLSCFIVVQVFHLNGPIWFFLSSAAMYFSGAWLFAASSYYASNAIKNKALGTSIMTFLNLLSAVLGVIFLGYLHFKSLVSFIIVFALFLTIGLIAYSWLRREIKAF